MKYFSKNVRFLREQAGLRQYDIEKVLGVKRTTWNNYESGLSRPTLEGFVEIAQHFDVSESDLLHVDIAKAFPAVKKHVAKHEKQNEAKEENGLTTTIGDLRKTIIAQERIIELEGKIKEELTSQLEAAQKTIVDYRARLKDVETKYKTRGKGR
jgi:transcriptional regulator with XRE-family HTH domain